MRKGRYEHYTREDAAKIAKLRKIGLTWDAISERLGISKRTCHSLWEKAR
jgi:hypothetical protein